MKPTYKEPQIWNHQSNLNAQLRPDGKRVYIPDAIEKDVCAKCDGKAIKFLQEIDRKEYALTGLCSQCQDELYNALGRDNPGGEPI